MDGFFCQDDLQKLNAWQPQAVEKWFNAYSDRLYTFAYYRVAKDSDLAAEVVQETFIQALRKIPDYDPKRGSMIVWLTFICKNKISRALRLKRKHISYDQTWQDIDRYLLHCFELIATEPLPDEVLEKQETAELIQMTLTNIPGNYKFVLTEHYYQHKKLKEISVSMGISEGAAKVMLHRARKAFKAAFLKLARSCQGPQLLGGDING